MDEEYTDVPSQLDEMRASRENFTTVFLKFTENNKFFDTHTFCFYEGEDGKYYDSRIRNYFTSNFLTYTVGNKKQVLKLRDKIKHEGIYENVNKMFFIDRDYEESLSGSDNDLYETPCYSIENLYAQKSCFEQILQSEFGLNITDDDYIKCMNDFTEKFNDFNEGMIEFNALVLLRREKSDSNSNFKFSSVNTNHLFISNILSVTKSDKYDKTIEKIIDKLQFDVSELQKTKEKIVSIQDYNNNFRGKNQLDFVVSIIDNLKKLNSNSQYFQKKLRCVKINITSNRLSELSQYAVTPPCLNEFLLRHCVN